MALDLKWDHDGTPGMSAQHASGAIVLVALVFLVAVRMGFRGVSVS